MMMMMNLASVLPDGRSRSVGAAASAGSAAWENVCKHFSHCQCHMFAGLQEHVFQQLIQ